MASGKWMYTPEEAAEFMVDSDFSEGVSSDFTDSGSDDQPELSSETKQVIESENELDIIMEFIDEAQKNNNQPDEEPGEKGDSCDQLP